MYLGFCFYSGIVRPINQEMTAIAKIICYSQFPRGDMPCHTGPHGEASGSIRRQKEQEENVGINFYCSFCGKEWVKQTKQARQVYNWLV